MTIGIIEDDRLLSQSLKVVLEKEGYRTLQVYTKKDAGQILREQRSFYWLISVSRTEMVWNCITP